jgi:hypothetical protein
MLIILACIYFGVLVAPEEFKSSAYFVIINSLVLNFAALAISKTRYFWIAILLTLADSVIGIVILSFAQPTVIKLALY